MRPKNGGMVCERDIWASAGTMLTQHGENAATEAAMKADELASKGELAGQRTWQRIMTAIEWLQDNRGRDPFKVDH